MNINPIGGEFRRLRESGMQAGASQSVGTGFVKARDALARGLIRLGVRPNHITVAGFLAGSGAAVCMVCGAGHHAPWESAVPGVPQSYWPLAAAIWLVLASACDMIDGAVARLGNLGSAFGGVLDSTLDRLSEIVVYLGMIIHFALVGNVTYVTLAALALCHGQLISYVKARTEEHVPDCGVGFWQRGERCAAMLLAALCAHLPILLWQQAILPFFTFLLRLHFARAAIRAQETGQSPPRTIPDRHGANLLRPWRYPRGTIPYDLTVAVAIGFFVALPWIDPRFYGAADPLGKWLA